MKRDRKERFYVFYDKNDMVLCFGTPTQLVNDGLFKEKIAVKNKAFKIRKGIVKGAVVVLS